MGFSHYSLIGWIMYNGDVNQTFEGDNNILVQQTAKFLLKNLSVHKKGQVVHETCEFLNAKDLASSDFDLTNSEVCKTLIVQRAKDKITKTGGLLLKDMSKWEDMQGIHVREMSEAYYHLYLVESFSTFLSGI